MSLLRRFRLFLLIGNAFWKKEKKLILLSFVAAIGLLLLIVKVTPYIPRPKPTEKIGVVGNYTFENLPLNILKQASSGLTKIDADGTALPSLAQDWIVSDEGKTYTFSLANNIFWQDGIPVNSSEINLKLSDVQIEKPDENTIVFRLAEPFSPFPLLLSVPIFKNNYIGTGRYQIKQVKIQGSFVKKMLLVGPDKNIHYIFYPTDELAFTAFKLGEIDQLPESYSNPFSESWSNFIDLEEKVRKDQYIGLFINTRNPDLSDKNLRQALAYATLQPEDETKVRGPINPDSWAYNPDVKDYQANAKQAKKLYTQFLQDSNKDSLKLRIDTTSNFLLFADQIKNNWNEILGIETEIALIDRIPTDFQILLIVSQIPNDPDQYSFWHSTQNTNLTGYQSPKVDKILEDARRIQDQQERRDKYLDFQKFLLEDSPVIFLSHPKTITVKRKPISSRLKLILPFSI